MAPPSVNAIKVTVIDNKAANINDKIAAVYAPSKQPQIKNCKIINKLILLGIMLTFRRQDGYDFCSI